MDKGSEGRSPRATLICVYVCFWMFDYVCVFACVLMVRDLCVRVCELVDRVEAVGMCGVVVGREQNDVWEERGGKRSVWEEVVERNRKLRWVRVGVAMEGERRCDCGGGGDGGIVCEAG